MVPEIRREFNRRWRPELYADLLRRIDDVAGTHVEFRCSETPIFLPANLVDKMVRYGRELCEQLLANPEYLKAAHAAIPAQFRAPGESVSPLFVQADFGLIETGERRLEPKLVEIQGFPSLYAFQPALAREYEQVYNLCEIGRRLDTFLGGLDRASYAALLERAILNGHDSEEVVLLEIDPYRQKTLPDFLLTQQLFGVKIADIRELEKRGSKLYLNNTEIRRIYNRVIVDELARKGVEPVFRFTDDVDVEWAGHPNWFFELSKFSLPWLRHECVPESWFLSDLQEWPENLEDYVLKPLYSFAGIGVKIGPTVEELRAIPQAERANYILQRRMNFAATIETPSGMTKAEIRIMYIHDGNELKPVTTIVRTGRGKMMGVDFNKNLDWVGASAGFTIRE